jgi:ribonuclease Y
MMTLHPLWFMAALLLAGGLGYAIHSIVVRLKLAAAHRNARIIEENARREADVLLREARVQAKDEALRAREQQDQENWNRRQELRALEERLVQREAALDRKAEHSERRDLTLTLKQHAQDGMEGELRERQAGLAHQEAELRNASNRSPACPASRPRLT